MVSTLVNPKIAVDTGRGLALSANMVIIKDESVSDSLSLRYS